MNSLLNSLSHTGQSAEGLPVYERAEGTLLRSEKGPVIPPPVLGGLIKVVGDVIINWPGIIATSHWDPFNPTRVDGIDFYFGEEELGHIHLDGSAHIATSPGLGKALVAEGLAKPLPYVRGWIEEKVQRTGSEAMIHLFRYNYNRLSGGNLPK